MDVYLKARKKGDLTERNNGITALAFFFRGCNQSNLSTQDMQI
jgi:hypothetical protein